MCIDSGRAGWLAGCVAVWCGCVVGKSEKNRTVENSWISEEEEEEEGEEAAGEATMKDRSGQDFYGLGLQARLGIES